jgi:hypothetical protein
LPADVGEDPKLRWRTKDHHAHIPVISFQGDQAFGRRLQAKASGAYQIVTSPGRRIERLFVPHHLGEKRRVRKSLGPDCPFGQQDNVIVMAGVALGERHFRRPVVFGVEDCGLLPESPLGEQRHHRHLAIGNQIRKFFGSERADAETVARHEFRMSSELKHDLGNNVSKTLGRGRRVTKADHVRVLPADTCAPGSGRAEQFLAPRGQGMQEFARDVLPACGHHLGENTCPPRPAFVGCKHIWEVIQCRDADLVGFGLMETDYKALESRWIDRGLAERARLRRVDSLTGAEVIGRKSGSFAGILIPYFHPASGHVREYRLRRDQPDLEYGSAGNLKERQRYLSAPGRSNMLYLPPGVGESFLRDPALTVVITEGEFKAVPVHFRLFFAGPGDVYCR